MTNISSFIAHTKVAKVVLSGELTISSPLAIKPKGFSFLKYFPKKEGFLKVMSNT